LSGANEETRVVARYFADLFLVSISFAVVFAISFLAALLVDTSAVRAAVVGGVCGFAVAFVFNAAIVIGRRTGAERRRQLDEGDAGSGVDTDRRSR
jgi:hypothetical protein